MYRMYCIKAESWMSNADLGVLSCGTLTALRVVLVIFPSVSMRVTVDWTLAISEERVERVMWQT